MNIRTSRLYDYLLLMLLTFLVVFEQVNNIYKSQIISKITFGIALIILIIGILANLLKNQTIPNLLYILLMVLLLVVLKKDYIFVYAISIAIACLPLKINRFLSIYRLVLFFEILIIFLLACLLILPIRSRTGTLAFGFVNENLTGMTFSILSLLTLFNFRNHVMLSPTIKSIALNFLSIILNIFLFKDYTMVALYFLFAIFLMLNKYIKSQKVMYVSAIVPALSFCVSYFIAKNFLHYLWISKLNIFMAWRPFIWHYYLSTYPISLFGASSLGWNANNQILSGAVDGSYIYMLIFFGYVVLMIVILGLMLCNILLVRKNILGLLALIVSIEIVGISENIIFNYDNCFLFVMLFLSYNFEWYNVPAKLNLSRRYK